MSAAAAVGNLVIEIAAVPRIDAEPFRADLVDLRICGGSSHKAWYMWRQQSQGLGLSAARGALIQYREAAKSRQAVLANR